MSGWKQSRTGWRQLLPVQLAPRLLFAFELQPGEAAPDALIDLAVHGRDGEERRGYRTQRRQAQRRRHGQRQYRDEKQKQRDAPAKAPSAAFLQPRDARGETRGEQIERITIPRANTIVGIPGRRSVDHRPPFPIHRASHASNSPYQ